MSKRIRYIDIAKGMAIILVIIGHTINDGIIKSAIYSFHMPFFFVVSGFFCSRKSCTCKFTDFVAKRAKRYLLPYMITVLCIIGYMCLRMFMKHGNVVVEFYKWILAGLWGLASTGLPGAPESIERIGALWFLQALFWGEVIIYCTKRFKIVGDKFIGGQFVLLLTLNAVSVFMSKNFIWLPMNIGTGVAASVFIYIGQSIREYGLLDKYISDKKTLVASGFVLLGCMFGVIHMNSVFIIAELQYPLKGVEILGGVAGSVLLLSFCKTIDENQLNICNFFEKLGRNSLYIMCFHLFDLDCFMFIGRLRSVSYILFFRFAFDILVPLLMNQTIVNIRTRLKMTKRH